jgi:DNA-binding response OmpR family regulator
VVCDTSANAVASAERIRLLRECGGRVPILVLGQAWASDCAANVLDAGADDCLVGAFSPTELRARICALLRRSSGLWVLPAEAMRLNRDCLTVHLDRRDIALTRTQFAILEYLVRYRELWCAPERIIRDVLGTSHQKGTSLVRFHVHNLRNALGESGVRIRWERGKGYMFTLAPTIEDAAVALPG